jgi:hypothetical protein
MQGGAGDEKAGEEGEMVYDGAGGCDLLHDKRQIHDQELTRGNLALTGNKEHAIPVRVTRKNKCKESYTGRYLPKVPIFLSPKHETP